MLWDPWDELADVLDPPPLAPPPAELGDPVDLATTCDPYRYRAREHLRIIANNLAGLARGEYDRLIINTPPQVGKSHTAVEWGVFWWLCNHLTHAVIIACYGEDLAEDRGFAVRRLVERYGAKYGLHLQRGTTSKKDWQLTTGGSVRSIGIGSGVTGHNANAMWIDDPIRSRADAESLRKRDNTWGWYTADLLSRLAPGAPVTLIQTPWHVDDLRARVLRQEGDRATGGRWRVVVMPALATAEDDPLGRAVGDPLPHPDERLPVNDKDGLLRYWLTVRASQHPLVWQALYQCDPQPAAGVLLSWEMLQQRRCYQHGGPGCAQPQTVAVSIDPSGGGRSTAGIIGGYLGVDGRLYWTHDRSGVMPSDQWARAACELAADTGADRFIVETNYGGDQATLILRTAWEALAGKDPARFSMFCPRIVAVNARRNKVLRAEPIAQQVIEDRARTAAYLPEFESEWATWQPGPDSPGRIDAGVHLAYALLPVPMGGDISLEGAAMLSETVLANWGGGV